jgi:cell division protein FtsB
VYLTQEDLQNLKKKSRLELLNGLGFLGLLAWVGTFFVGLVQDNVVAIQQQSKAMAVAETKINQLNTTVSTLESENSEFKKVQASQHERILKLEFQVQQSLKKQ